MTVINDLTNRVDRLALSYGRHVATGKGTKHTIDTDQVFFQRALGWASLYDPIAEAFFCRGWDSVEKLYYQGFEITGDHFTFHSGGPADAPDAYFPSDIPHPKASYIGGKLPDGMKVDGEPDQIIGIFKTTKVADYNEDGDQIDEAGDLVVTADPDDALFYSANPALEIADMKRRTRRSLVSINWPIWCHFRDYCKALINWDDGALTPHQVSLALHAGGALTPDQRYWIRVATLKGGDISSASHDRASDGVTTASIVVSGGNLSFDATWASQIDRGATGYRVYIGTAEGAEDRYFTIADGAINTLTITTLAGATMGAPPAIATGALLRQIPRFESHVFFPPPFDFIAGLDRIAQISCMDWRYSGGLLEFLTPEVRDPVFTVNMAEIANFKTHQTDRRQKPNQIIVNYRNLDDQYLSQADPPVEINREDLQAKEGVRPFQIDMGCAYRSQAQRVGSYWARRLIDSDWMAEFDGSPKTYIVLPGDRVNLTHDVPNWTDVAFYIESKEEPEDTKAGYPMTGRIAGAWYSDTDSTPLPSPLPVSVLNPFAAPPVVDDCVLTEEVVEVTTGDAFEVIRGGVTFAEFVGQQRGRVWVWKPSDSEYKATDITLFPDETTHQASFEIKAIETGTYKIKVVTESTLGVSLPIGDHPEFTLDVTGDLLKGPEPTNFEGVFYPDTGDLLEHWSGTAEKGGSRREIYDLEMSVPGDGDFSTVRAVTLDRGTPAVPVPWVIDSTSGGGETFALVAPGGFNSTVHPGIPGLFIALKSAVHTSVEGDLLFQFEIATGMPTKIGIYPYDEDPATSEYGLWWGVGSSYTPGDAQPDGEIAPPGINRTWITADGQEVHPIIGADRFAILIGKDRIARFLLNYEGSQSVPLLSSPRPVKDVGSYRAYAYMEASAGIRNANWVRPVPDWLYLADAQKADNSAVLPGQIKARVRQHSFYTGGPPSDWVNGTFNRP